MSKKHYDCDRSILCKFVAEQVYTNTRVNLCVYEQNNMYCNVIDLK